MDGGGGGGSGGTSPRIPAEAKHSSSDCHFSRSASRFAD